MLVCYLKIFDRFRQTNVRSTAIRKKLLKLKMILFKRHFKIKLVLQVLYYSRFFLRVSCIFLTNKKAFWLPYGLCSVFRAFFTPSRSFCLPSGFFFFRQLAKLVGCSSYLERSSQGCYPIR